MAQRRIALFGGTFDPIHLGHTQVAQAAATRIDAEKVVFIPAKCSPLKGFSPRAGDRARLEMIALAIAGTDVFAVSDCELQRPAPSYTLDTVRQFQRQYGPQTTIHWLLGADAVGDLAHWYRVRELIDECHVTTMQRAGYEPPDLDRFESIWGPHRVAKLKGDIIETPRIDISSTEVRRRLAAGGDVRDMLPPDVVEYIHRHGLYQ
ncbi:MAG: nicotinate (nicotinamide) nucleotide adenylyltransferase [Planctomycetes bacterium RBG_13_62_9]|nr:MAG: nicotinate (nicotinamide) nucleotide adenylyltransferase [Planctomycetes bacterium RBG_13_62_9]